MSSRSSRFWPMVMVVAACISTPATACQVPVFQYALERWLPDTYQLLVFHRGPLTAAQAALIQRLQAAANAEGAPSRSVANVQVWPVDVAAAMPDSIAALQRRAAPPSLPYVVAVAPVHTAPADEESLWSAFQPAPPEDPERADPRPGAAADAELVIVWSGPLEAEAVERLLDSPARQEIAKRLLSGHSVVWIMLEGDDTKANAALEQALRAQLDGLARELARTAPEDQNEPPEASQGEPGDPYASDFESTPPWAPVEVRFSLLRIGRNDQREQVLRSLLQSQAPDLLTTGKPLLFPVFGRGRVLGGVEAGGNLESAVAEACAFLVGDCSCLVKEMNFGFDLLMSADWESVTAGAMDLTGAAPATAAAAIRTVPATAAPPEAGGFFGTFAIAGGVLALLVLAAVVGSLVLMRRTKGAGR